MKKFLGLDIGEKRIGVALSQDRIVVPFDIIDSTNLSKALSDIARICRSESIEKIIIGIPKSSNLKPKKITFQIDKIHKFAMELTKNLNIEITYIDETLTSKEAERKIKNLKLNPKTKEYKEKIDKLSAQLILEQFISKSDD